MTRVQRRIKPELWKAFLLVVVQERDANTVSQSVGINVASVYKAKSRVPGMILEEYRRLTEEC